jgi:O-antigen ligase/polysaccharide polymerase Wzy-like membrane protein
MAWTPLMAAGGAAIFAALVVAIVFQPHLTVLLLPALGLYALMSLRPEKRRWPFSWRAVWVLPSIFALYVALSASWSRDPQAALVAGTLFGLFLLATRVAFLAALEAEPGVLERLSGYFVAAVFTAALLLAITIYSHGALHKAICAVFPALAPTDRDFVRLDGDVLEFVGLPYFNRNVALLNLLLWPALLVLAKRVVDWRTALLPIGLFALVALTTLGSDHQTSLLALGASSLIFLIYRVSPRSARVLIMLGWVAALLLVRPAVLIAYEQDLHKASWMQESARARIILWAYTARQMSKAPILGIGAQTTRAESEAARPAEALPGHAFPQWTGRHGHNIYLQTWYELGVVGAGLLLGLGLSILSWLWTLPRPGQDYAGAAFVCASAMCASSFGMWQAWFIAACMLVVPMVTLGLSRAATATGSPSSEAS